MSLLFCVTACLQLTTCECLFKFKTRDAQIDEGSQPTPDLMAWHPLRTSIWAITIAFCACTIHASVGMLVSLGFICSYTYHAQLELTKSLHSPDMTARQKVVEVNTSVSGIGGHFRPKAECIHLLVCQRFTCGRI